MTWSKIVGPIAITSSQRNVASAVIYGLSLTVRFTSATGEEADSRLMLAQSNDAGLSTMQKDGAPIPSWPAIPSRSIVCQRGQTCNLKSCRAARQPATPMPDCLLP